MSEVAAYVTVEPVHIAVYVSEAAPSGGGVTDHGALTGLSDDDHPQYHNDSRGDARYDALGSAATVANAVVAEAGFREAADAQLLSDVNDAINGEAAERNAADTGLAGQITTGDAATLDGANDYTDAAIAQEVADRNAAIASAIVGAFHVAGSWDASGGTWPTTGTGVSSAVRAGDTYKVSVAGTIGGSNFDVGDSFYARINAPGQTASNWERFEHNDDQATESTRGTATIASNAEVSDSTTTNVLEIVTPSRMWRALLQVYPAVAEFMGGVRSATLDGLSLVTGTAITAADTVLTAMGKLQKQITDEIALARNASNLSSGTVANARLDALLAAIGNLTTAADKMIRLTGTDTVDQVDLKLGVSAAYSGSLTWTGTGPTGTANNTQWFTHVGNLVTWRISITYASAGSGITGLTATLPAEFPTPAIPTGFTGANAFIAACHAGRFITTPTGSLTINTNCNLKRNGADNGFEIVATIASGAYRSVILSGSYHTA